MSFLQSLYEITSTMDVWDGTEVALVNGYWKIRESLFYSISEIKEVLDRVSEKRGSGEEKNFIVRLALMLEKKDPEKIIYEAIRNYLKNKPLVRSWRRIQNSCSHGNEYLVILFSIGTHLALDGLNIISILHMSRILEKLGFILRLDRELTPEEVKELNSFIILYVGE